MSAELRTPDAEKDRYLRVAIVLIAQGEETLLWAGLCDDQQQPRPRYFRCAWSAPHRIRIFLLVARASSTRTIARSVANAGDHKASLAVAQNAGQGALACPVWLR